MSKTWPWLPTELYVHILSFFPPTKDLVDLSVKTLVSCLSANSCLRTAALHSGLWEPHYRTRYTECVEEREAARCEAAGGNWRLMYVARRVLDRRALALVDEIRLQLHGRHTKASTFVREFSFDVWDVLELEAQLPLPVYFRSDEDAGDGWASDVKDVPHALPRRYWARAVMGVIARHHALQLWARVYSKDEDNESVTFEEALAGLSAFFDESPRRVYVWLGQVADHCRQTLLDEGIEMDPNRPRYDLRILCVRIRNILRAMGFENAEGTDFYNLMNQFPHALMREAHRRTIPMSLVYIFVSVCHRLGIRAAPTNFPGRVLCHITPADPHGNEMLFDLCKDQPPLVFTSHGSSKMLSEVGLPPDARPDLVRPCQVGTILHRAAANIIISVRWNQRRAMGSFTERYAWCSYAAFCIFLLHSQENQILSHILDSKPLDALAVLTDVISPVLGPEMRVALVKHCAELVQTDEDFASTVWLRSEHKTVNLFVGLVVQHVLYEYVGCVIGWHPMCLAKETLTPVMEVQRLTRGWEQPFYWIITVDGAKRYVAEEDLTPVLLNKEISASMFQSRTIFGRFFEGVEVDEKQHRGRLLPSQELQTLFPEDDRAGAIWIANGYADEGKPWIEPLLQY